MEYSSGDTLQKYLKKKLQHSYMDNKYNFAYQLACALSCLHEEVGIVIAS
jgi:hypothetical protein